ncbi:MAG: hypothetical protein LUM44_00960 [Pyrinomonadaceae bacterium]|nr:hypothetical protein [Pyrinomonadaceae bacterium]
MIIAETINEKSDSLIDLLTAQCGDLEKLLALARQETRAAEEKDFEMIMEIVSERELLSRRLETFQQQISELRGKLTEADELNKTRMSARVVELASQTLAQDATTRKLLTASRLEASNKIMNLSNTRRGANAYIGENKRGLAYDRCA